MRKLILAIVGILLMTVLSSAQVDTLQLVEIGSIEAPSEITNLYIEDLDGDSLKEIILTTATNVHIYNGISYEHIWISPEMINPEDLLFEDINFDGFIDFSVKDTTNIHLFDPHNDAIIWTSPEIDSTYRCYTIGDRNEDNETDLVIINKEIFSRYEYSPNYDTVWIQIYDGTEYSNPDTIIHLLRNIFDDMFGCYYQLSNIPTSTCVSQFGLYENEEIHIVVSTFIEDDFVCPDWPQYDDLEDSGSIILFNANNMSYDTTFTIGYFDEVTIEEISNDKYLYMITKEYIHSSGSTEESVNDYVIGNDFIYSINNIWEGQGNFEQFNGFVLENFIENDYSNEVCYGSYQTLTLRNIDGSETYWIIGSLLGLDKVIGSYKYESLYANIMVICKFGDVDSEYRFYDSQDGSLLTVIDQYSGIISDVDNLHNDGNDEIFSIAGYALYIFGLEPTAIDDDPITPNQPCLLANYPNPFNSSTMISYELHRESQVAIEIYDILGRRVETLVQGKQLAGYHQVVWNAKDQPSGMYFYRIEAGDYTETRKMVLLK